MIDICHQVCLGVCLLFLIISNDFIIFLLRIKSVQNLDLNARYHTQEVATDQELPLRRRKLSPNVRLEAESPHVGKRKL